MVLGSLDPRISYETSLYYSTKAVSINYVPGSLTLEPGGWDYANSKFLGKLFGYEYDLDLPPDYTPPGSDTEESQPDWNEYLKRVWEGLKGGAAVQVCQGWMNVIITEDGQMFGPGGVDPKRGGASLPGTCRRRLRRTMVPLAGRRPRQSVWHGRSGGRPGRQLGPRCAQNRLARVWSVD